MTRDLHVPFCSLWLTAISFAVCSAACGGSQLPAGTGGKGPGATPDAGGGPMGPGTGPGGGMKPGGGMMPMPPAMGGGMMGLGGATAGVPTVGPPKVVWTGGGPAGLTPLAPGCTPTSALECPTVNGTCATTATAHSTGATIGSICFYGVDPGSTTTTTSSSPEATVEYLHETAGGQEYYRFRVTFDPQFADNTYGSNAIGWGTRGHTYNDLVGSDHVELQLFDGAKTMVMDMKLDYISVDASKTCGYSALGVQGGEGKILLGDAKYVLGATTSEARNLNGCGYCSNSACGGSCTVNSPVTDTSFTANAAAPSWDYRVQYEVWIDAGVFAGKGFGGANVPYVHASPSKASTNTIVVTPKPCPGGGGGGGGCPTGTVDYLTSEGQQTCVPTPGGGGCPAGTTNYLLSEGAVCVPTPSGGACPTGYQVDPTSEGSRCI